MEFPSQDIIQIIIFLLPGFVAAWVFYGLTAHPKQTPFERIIQALIFTAFIQATIPLAKMGHEWVRSQWVISPWSKEIELAWLLAIAILLGLIFSLIAHTDWLHAACRFLKLTRRTSYPSEWFSTFNREAVKDRDIILHFKDGRRMLGYPVEWPDRCDSGHFAMANVQWVLEDNTAIELHVVHRFLVPVTDIRFVEIYKTDAEIVATKEQLKQTEQKAVSLRKQDNQPETGGPTNGKQSTTNSTQREARNGGKANPAATKTANITPSTSASQSKVKGPNERAKRKR